MWSSVCPWEGQWRRWPWNPQEDGEKKERERKGKGRERKGREREGGKEEGEEELGGVRTTFVYNTVC